MTTKYSTFQPEATILLGDSSFPYMPNVEHWSGLVTAGIGLVQFPVQGVLILHKANPDQLEELKPILFQIIDDAITEIDGTQRPVNEHHGEVDGVIFDWWRILPQERLTDVRRRHAEHWENVLQEVITPMVMREDGTGINISRKVLNSFSVHGQYQLYTLLQEELKALRMGMDDIIVTNPEHPPHLKENGDLDLIPAKGTPVKVDQDKLKKKRADRKNTKEVDK